VQSPVPIPFSRLIKDRYGSDQFLGLLQKNMNLLYGNDSMPISKISEYIIEKVNSLRVQIDSTVDLWGVVQEIFYDRSSSHVIKTFASAIPIIV